MSVGLVIAGASIFLLLGVAHTVFTLQSKPDSGPMMPTNPVVRDAMHEVGGLGLAPDLQSSLYRAWIGFNLSHSVGIIAIAGVVLAQAVVDLGAATDHAWFLALVFVAPLVYVVLAVNYWFDKPRDAIFMATVLLWVGVVIELL